MIRISKRTKVCEIRIGCHILKMFFKLFLIHPFIQPTIREIDRWREREERETTNKKLITHTINNLCLFIIYYNLLSRPVYETLLSSCIGHQSVFWRHRHSGLFVEALAEWHSDSSVFSSLFLLKVHYNTCVENLFVENAKHAQPFHCPLADHIGQWSFLWPFSDTRIRN